MESKFVRKPFKSINRTSKLYELIHTNLCVLKGTPTRGSRKYFVIFINGSSRYCYIYLLKSKDEAKDMFKTYKAEVENQLAKTIKTTAPYAPQQNGVADRKDVIPAISACIINTIFPIITWLDLVSLGQNNQPSDWAFYQSIASFS